MTVLGNAALRRLALNVLAHHAGPAASSETVAAAAHRAYDDLVRVTAPLIGQVGVDALAGRALHLARRDRPWLVHAHEDTPESAEHRPGTVPEQAEGPLDRVIVSLQRQDPGVATEAAGALFATFTGLLVTFIGEPLTVSLLRKAWPDAFPETSPEET